MKFGSVCSGIEAASVAWHTLGWRAAWLAEIEKFPSAVLAHHYPDVPNLGDMTALPARIASGEIEAPDIFCGGTPCQAFSVAGLRRSLDDARGNLSLTFCEIADAIDAARLLRGEQPAIVFWENVPGVLNTKDNAFGCFLAGLAGEGVPLKPAGGRWTNAGCVLGPQRAVAWRVLDAQYFGVAQRRRRVFVVASARDGFDPAAVLFEREGVRRDTAPSREKGEGAAASTAPSLTASGRGVKRTGESRGQDPVVACFWNGEQITQTLDAVLAKGQTMPEKNRFPDVLVPDTAHSLRASGFDASEDGTGRGTPLVPVAIRPDATPKWNHDIAFTLTQPSPTGGGHPQAVAFALRGRQNGAQPEIHGTGDSVGSLRAGSGGSSRDYVAFHPTQDPISSTDGSTHAMGCGSKQGQASIAVAVRDVSQTITSNYGKQVDSSDTGLGPNVVFPAMQVRRLTPRECERLQGFPDDYTLITVRGKPAADGPRYKALGNSWAVPNVRWIGERIAAQLRRAAANDNTRK